MLNALQQLEKYIEKGEPPTSISQEHTSNGKLFIRFTWPDDTALMVNFETVIYIKALTRFKEFWEPSLPSNILKQHTRPSAKVRRKKKN